ncbi:hypothetical protein [Endozoicomonas atrinae]|uniref:hypothetical protein n=1 Tax=Endozoicomonas atrinae TaxID=1333660 RepID=UPI001112F430|nr:hypothetical protein [Endozoicomonas atrinae]
MSSISGFGGIASQPMALFLLPYTGFPVEQADSNVINNRVMTESLNIAIQIVWLFSPDKILD